MDNGKKKFGSGKWETVKKLSKKNHNHRTKPTNDIRRKSKQTTMYSTPFINQQKAKQPGPFTPTISQCKTVMLEDMTHDNRQQSGQSYSW